MDGENVDILMITYNRPEYTRRALGRLLESCDSNVRVWVWHNGGKNETLHVVESFSGHPGFHKLQVSAENKKLRVPTNWFWSNTNSRFVGKVDDDCLVPDGWIQKLKQAHVDNRNLGAVSCWFYHDEDYLPEVAAKKIIPLAGGHRLLANPWIGGSGYLLKRDLIDECGEIKPDESFTSYCLRSALKGWQHGWYFPFVKLEHMDDPRSPYCSLKTEEDFLRNRPLSAGTFGVRSLAEWKQRVRYSASVVQTASPDPRHHVGWRAAVKRANMQMRRLLGMPPSWRMHSRQA